MLEVQKLVNPMESLWRWMRSVFCTGWYSRDPSGTKRSRKIDDHQKYRRSASVSGADRNSGTSCQKCGGKETVCLCSGDACHV